MKRIKNYWLDRDPPTPPTDIYHRAKYLLFDGTYFHKDGCLVIMMDHISKQKLSYSYIDKESYHSVHPILADLRDEGLQPKAITMDGHRFVIKAIREVWPRVTIQRCMYHILRQGLQWLRVCPKTQAGVDLRIIVKSVMKIKTEQDKADFLNMYRRWYLRYKDPIRNLPKDSPANKDLQKVMALINHALPDMFHYIDDPCIAPTTNLLENLYSQLKHHYKGHRGLTEKHRISYLKWYCYLKTLDNSNTS